MLDATASPDTNKGKVTVEIPAALVPGASFRPTSIAAGVNAALTSKPPKGFSGGNTNDMGEQFLHCLLYGEIDSWKTTTAARFGGPSRTLIVLTRAPEQLIPLDGQGFRYVRVENSDALRYALQFPEKAADAIGWPEWKDIPDRVLVVDDMTEGVNFIVEDNETNDEGKERKDGRQIYKGANADLAEMLASLKRKPMHLIMTALAKVDLHPIFNEETVGPDLPKGARTRLLADLEYVFFMKRATHKMVTTGVSISFTKKNEFGKDITGHRDIIARNKLPGKLCDLTPSFLSLEIPMDLAAMWKKIQAAKK